MLRNDEIILINQCIQCLVVPAIAPPNVSWSNTTSTSLQVEWSIVPKPLVNGILLGYRVFIWKESEGPTSQWSVTIPATNLTSEIAELEKYTRYCGQVEAFTRIGAGPRSLVDCTRTSEDGELYYFITECQTKLFPTLFHYNILF